MVLPWEAKAQLVNLNKYGSDFKLDGITDVDPVRESCFLTLRYIDNDPYYKEPTPRKIGIRAPFVMFAQEENGEVYLDPIIPLLDRVKRMRPSERAMANSLLEDLIYEEIEKQSLELEYEYVDESEQEYLMEEAGG